MKLHLNYVTPSLNTMLGRNRWVLMKMKKEAQDSLASALRASGSVSLTQTTSVAASNSSSMPAATKGSSKKTTRKQSASSSGSAK